MPNLTNGQANANLHVSFCQFLSENTPLLHDVFLVRVMASLAQSKKRTQRTQPFSYAWNLVGPRAPSLVKMAKLAR